MSSKEPSDKKLKTEKFEGLICSYPLCTEKNKSLCWEMEHHAKGSRGGYVVNIGSKREVFFELEKAVDFYNGGKN